MIPISDLKHRYTNKTINIYKILNIIKANHNHKELKWIKKFTY